MRTLALIPARGGSKGLPKKNIMPIAGKPLIAWTIEQATESKHVDRVVVSTDNAEIAEVARNCGADVPFMRPPELATDEAKTVDVALHALAKLKEDEDRYDVLALLEPTFPTRDAKDIDICLEILNGNPRALAIVSVARLTSTHPEFNVVIDERGLHQGVGRRQFQHDEEAGFERPVLFRRRHIHIARSGAEGEEDILP